MKSLKGLRELAIELARKGIVPPYFIEVIKADLDDLRKLTGYVPVNEFGPAAAQAPRGFQCVGACEHFQFVIRDRRVGPCDRRRGSNTYPEELNRNLLAQTKTMD